MHLTVIHSKPQAEAFDDKEQRGKYDDDFMPLDLHGFLITLILDMQFYMLVTAKIFL